MKITTVGIDLAKNVFQVHGIDERGKTVLRKQLRRAQVAVFFGNLPPCVIGMEAWQNGQLQASRSRTQDAESGRACHVFKAALERIRGRRD
jgi:transposase